MKKILKALGIILLVFFAAAIILPFVFKDKIVAVIKEEANKNLNASFDFKDFDLSLIKSFPDFQFELNELSIIGKDAFAHDTLIYAKKIYLSVNLMSVIKGDQYKINDITISEALLQGLVHKDGKANWDITKPDTTSTSASSEPSKFKMQLQKFELEKTTIVYDDEQMGFSTKLYQTNHTLKGDFTQDIFDIQTNTDIEKWDLSYGGVRYFNKLHTNIDADLVADMPNFKFTFKENKFQLNELHLGLDGWFAMPKEDMDMDIKFNCKETRFASILSLVPGCYTSDFKDVKTAGSLALDAFVKGIYNEKRMPAFGLNLLVKNAMFKYPSLPGTVQNINVDVAVKNANGNPDATLIDIHQFHVEMQSNPVDIAMHIANPVSDPFVDGTIKGKVDLNTIKQYIPLEADQKLSGLVSSDIYMKGHKSSIDNKKFNEFTCNGNLIIQNMNYLSKATPYGVMISNMNLHFTPQYAELLAFDSRLGKSDMHATGKMENFIGYALADEMLKGSFIFTSQYLDVNQLMGEETESDKKADTASSTGVVEVPSNLDFELKSTIGKLLYSNMEMQQVTGSISIRNSTVAMEGLKMNMLDGSLAVKGFYNSSDKKHPKVNFDMNISDWDVSKTYKTFNTIKKIAPIADYAKGKFSMGINFSSVLNDSMSPVLSTLSGGGKLHTQNIVISNLPMLQKVADVVKMLQYKQADLKDAIVDFTFSDGRVKVEPFDFKIVGTKMTLGGYQYFDQRIDYDLKAQIPTSEFGSAANNIAQGLISQANSKGASISMGDKFDMKIKIGGTFKNPTVSAGLADMGKSMLNNLKDKAKEEIDKKKAELEAKAKAELEKQKATAMQKANDEIEKQKAAAKSAAEKAKAEAEAKAKAEAEKAKKAAEEKLKQEAAKKIKGLFGK
jgi:hypothetical protein